MCWIYSYLESKTGKFFSIDSFPKIFRLCLLILENKLVFKWNKSKRHDVNIYVWPLCLRKSTRLYASVRFNGIYLGASSMQSALDLGCNAAPDFLQLQVHICTKQSLSVYTIKVYFMKRRTCSWQENSFFGNFSFDEWFTKKIRIFFHSFSYDEKSSVLVWIN